MTNKEILGRKILDLIEENKIKIKENEEIMDIEIDKILPNPDQPRVIFESNALKQLALSIKEHGVIQPVILKPSGENYQLVAGERRVRASKIAGKTTVPAIIRDYNSIYLAELAILENLQREDLSPIEEAVAYERAIKKLGLTQAELGKKIGKSRSYITNMIGLLVLPINVIEDVNTGLISMGHARVLSKLDDIEFISKLAERIKNEDLSVRRIEEIARNYKRKNPKKNSGNSISKESADVFDNFITSQMSISHKLVFSQKEIKIKFKTNQDMQKAINQIAEKFEVTKHE